MSELRTKPLTVVELAEYFSVPKSTVYYWVSARKIPYIKPGRHPLFFLDKVLEYFDQHTSGNTCNPALQRLKDSYSNRRSLKISSRVNLCEETKEEDDGNC